ncbi:sulfotransferase family protein [Thermopetrobacter sp. TC1]|uniref:sulfotransferase family protein n=1 Tax=Thermopetrobacter sp. TC1 TaxID=1495045 RepID=UPI001E5A45F8|nr:sulfotransferase family protein [Thermopetrobacter sp. TC1]
MDGVTMTFSADKLILAVKLKKYTRYPAKKLDYLTHCSQRNKFIYFCTPKVASSKLKILLQIAESRSLGLPDPQGYLQKEDSPLVGFIKLGVDLKTLFESDEFYRFTFVRNPYTRILSSYLEKIVHGKKRNRYLKKLGFKENADVSFREFLQALTSPQKLHLNPHWAPQFHFLRPDRIRYHFIGRLEHINDHLPAVVKRIYNDVNLNDIISKEERTHATGALEKVKKYYGTDEIELVRRLYINDFIYFSYPLDIELCSI